ncbi:MAG TPA: 3-phosphoshikimate 1-carboxyvinyltransferase [Gemmatimonadales bacterium]|nr:3-phosphoshikimate 1-carboxyvinyltransferase [Gemmatimonadales bacterium]
MQESDGILRVPGDKSITHRALMLAALAPGRSVIRGALTSLDARSTARVLRLLGAAISPLRTGAVITVEGRQRFRPPARVLDCGNSGTTARLLLGVLAAHQFPSTLTGDASLRRRPMRRITEPLVAMGAVLHGAGDRLPLTIEGGDLSAGRWTLPVASAQIKSALLLAAAVARVSLELEEPASSRDHTERMLRRFGFVIGHSPGRLQFEPTGEFRPTTFEVPGDPSSAAFLLAGALLAGISELSIGGVGCNPGRIGFLAVLQRMGAVVRIDDAIDAGGEPVGTITVTGSSLGGTTISPAEVPGLIDEIPMLACLAARADGTTRFEGVAELRVKESDRLALVARNLTAIGAHARVEGDDLVVTGSSRPLAGRVVTEHDHRIAMAFQMLGLSRGCTLQVDDPAAAAVSFPGFADHVDQLRRRR